MEKLIQKYILTRKMNGGYQAKRRKEEINLSPRNMKACHSVSTALLQSVVDMGTQSTMKSNIKTSHEFTSHIPRKKAKRNKSSSTNEMLQTDINVIAQGARVSSTHAREATNSHQNSQAINQ
jgi:NACalpha-BTF3-like transcription factor